MYTTISPVEFNLFVTFTSLSRAQYSNEYSDERGPQRKKYIEIIMKKDKDKYEEDLAALSPYSILLEQAGVEGDLVPVS